MSTDSSAAEVEYDAKEEPDDDFDESSDDNMMADHHSEFLHEYNGKILESKSLSIYLMCYLCR